MHKQEIMHPEHVTDPTVYKFRYFTPDSHVSRDTVLRDEKSGSSESLDSVMKKRTARSFLEPDENSFAQIRNRLSTLSLSTAYKTGLEPPVISPPFQRERRLPPRRISSISSKDTLERANDGHRFSRQRANSRTSFLSDDKEYPNGRRQLNLPRQRASETAALNKLNQNYLTPGQNPELFSRQIRLKDKAERPFGKNGTPRSSSPKSLKSTDSSGKVHLGLIESLDLNEKLNDVEKIKERYSNNTFMNSLTLYKLRGHDRCLKHEGTSDHVPRGTRIGSPDMSNISTKMSADSAYTINSVISPRLGISKWQWEPDKSHVNNQIDSRQKSINNRDRKTLVKRKKSVGFNMEPMEQTAEEQSDAMQQSPSSNQVTMKGIKSILKRSNKDSTHTDKFTPEVNSSDDEFLANESYHWKFQLPKIRSPIQSLRARPPISFRRKMYHFGDGVSNEFEQVISKYGNCRQSSWIREHSFVRDNSQFVSKV